MDLGGVMGLIFSCGCLGVVVENCVVVQSVVVGFLVASCW